MTADGYERAITARWAAEGRRAAATLRGGERMTPEGLATILDSLAAIAERDENNR